LSLELQQAVARRLLMLAVLSMRRVVWKPEGLNWRSLALADLLTAR
jgi:hypothetical protein